MTFTTVAFHESPCLTANISAIYYQIHSKFGRYLQLYIVCKKLVQNQEQLMFFISYTCSKMASCHVSVTSATIFALSNYWLQSIQFNQTIPVVQFIGVVKWSKYDSCTTLLRGDTRGSKWTRISSELQTLMLGLSVHYAPLFSSS